MGKKLITTKDTINPHATLRAMLKKQSPISDEDK